MATANRDVKLTIAAGVTGQDDVEAMGRSFADLAGEGKKTERAFDGTADSVDRMRAELVDLAAATKLQRAAEADATTAVKDARRAYDEQRDARARLRAEARAGNTDTVKFKADELAMTHAVIDAGVALRAKREALAAATTAAKTSAAAEQSLTNEIKAASTAIASSSQQQIANNAQLRASVESVGAQFRQLQAIGAAALGGSYVGGLIKDLAATADEAANLAARIKLVTGEGPQFQAAFNGVADIALRTNSALNDTAMLFARISKAGTDAGLSAQAAQSQALALTETINQAVQLSGASADASSAAITQLIQGLQSGVLRGDEFNSVMEQAPRLAQALATGLGRTTGGPRANCARWPNRGSLRLMS